MQQARHVDGWCSEVMFVMFTECNKLGMLMVGAMKSCLLCSQNVTSYAC